MRNLRFDFLGQVEIRLGQGELSVDVVDCDTVVDQGQESRIFTRLDELFGDDVPAAIEFCSINSASCIGLADILACPSMRALRSYP